MKLKQKLRITIILILFIFMSSKYSQVNAALQANGNTGKTDSVSNWLINVRKMETAGGTLGLQDTINGTNLTSSAGKSNNLDIHMEKNTEYGAMAILSASAYGNQNKIKTGETTTGNKSGVVMHFELGEIVSAGGLSATWAFNNASSKYKNKYYNNQGKIGDAMDETKGWHGGNWGWFGEDRSAMVRNYKSSIFSFAGNQGVNWNNAYSTRAVIVVGKDF